VPPWTDAERLAHEKEVLGFYVTGHPLGALAAALRRYADVTPGETAGKTGREVRAGGLLAGLRETRTKRGDTMAFASLEDLDGRFDLVIFAEPYARLRALLRRAAAAEGGVLPLLVLGTLEEGEPPKILVRDATELEAAEEKLASTLRLRVAAADLTRDRLLGLRRVLDSHPGDCAVLLHLLIPGESETVMTLPDGRGVRPHPELQRDIDGLFGRSVVELVW
jgi:DNA polymerase-3 subunit alpha